MGKRMYAFIFSGILSLIGFFAVFQIANGNANLGVDFAGGTAVQIKFTQSVQLHDVRVALEQGGLKDFDLQDLPTENKVLIRVKKQEETLGGFTDSILRILGQRFADKKPVVDSTTEIGRRSVPVSSRMPCGRFSTRLQAFSVYCVPVQIPFWCWRNDRNVS